MKPMFPSATLKTVDQLATELTDHDIAAIVYMKLPTDVAGVPVTSRIINISTHGEGVDVHCTIYAGTMSGCGGDFAEAKQDLERRINGLNELQKKVAEIIAAGHADQLSADEIAALVTKHFSA